MFAMSSTANDGRANSPIEVPEDIFGRVNTLCLALPEVKVRVDASLTRARSTAHSFDIRRRSFCLLVAREGRTGKPVRCSCCVPTQTNATLCSPLATRSSPREPAVIASGPAHRWHRLGRDP